MSDSPYSGSAVKRSTIYFLVGKVVSALLNFTILLWLVRLLTVPEYATYITLVASVEIAFCAAGLGIPWMEGRYFPEYRLHASKEKIIRFAGHFHGWHDHVCFSAGGADGVVDGLVEDVILLPPNDIDGVKHVLAERDDVAAVILEPTGASFGMIPTGGAFLHDLRAATAARKVLLIFDEVISGFRCSSGGAQKHFGVQPDLTVLAKILAGGFPGAAIVGRADILAPLDYTAAGPPRVMHQGTYNAEPVSAAAGIATLQQVRDTNALAHANHAAAMIREGCNEAIRRKGVSWVVHGCFSEFHIHPVGTAPPVQKGTVPLSLVHKIRLGMLCHGVDLNGWPGGLCSSVHTDGDVERTVDAFRRTLDWLGEDGAL